MKSWLKLTVLSALVVLVVGTGVAFAAVVDTTAAPTTTVAPVTVTYPLTTQETVDLLGANAGANQGLPRTGSSSSIPTAAVAAGMVAVGSVLAVAARRRNSARRPLS